MSRKSRATCGTKTSTDPAPPMTASERKAPTKPCATWWATCSASQPRPCWSVSWIGAATVKMVWKKANITATKTTPPQSGWSRTSSTARVVASGLGAW